MRPTRTSQMLTCTGPAVDQDRDRERPAVGRRHALDRHRADLEIDVALVLPVRAVHRLEEVALAVEQPDPDEREAEIGGRLQVIAGENAETARVDRQRLVDRELGREVRDRMLGGDGRVESGIGSIRGCIAARKRPSRSWARAR